MDDKNIELIQDKEEILFEIKDNIEITQHIMVLLVSSQCGYLVLEKDYS